MLMRSPSGRCSVMPPSVPGTSRFFSRMLANVPRTITRSLPRREPKELKSFLVTPCSTKKRPAGPSTGISPAGEMWSVVTESPSMRQDARAVDLADGAGSRSEADEERRLLNVSRGFLPSVKRAAGHGNGVPGGIAVPGILVTLRGTSPGGRSGSCASLTSACEGQISRR